MTDYVYQDAWDFHVQAGSPVLTGAYNGNDATMQPYFGTSGLTVNGKLIPLRKWKLASEHTVQNNKILF